MRLARGLLDDDVPEKELQEFLVRSLDQFKDHIRGAGSVLPPSAVFEVIRADRLAREAGLAISSETPETEPRPEGPSEAQIGAWVEGIEDAGGINPGRLTPGTGEILSAILSKEMDRHARFLTGCLESLLRHVEVRRKKSLGGIPSSSQSENWLERHSVAILFCEAASNRADLRFLNAAMKVNDWAYPYHRRLSPRPQVTRYVLALACQERAAQELLVP